MLRILSALILCALITGCTDETKHQSEFRGTWFLESRKPARGDLIQSPQISGLIEWFPTDKTRAYVHVSVTNNRESIRIVDGLYDLQGTTFTFQSNLRIGDIAAEKSDATYETTLQEGTGQISSDDARVTLTHDKGARFEFIGTQLTITHPNGTVDSWKRSKDQKGVLAK
ncbi:MAG: hypothetical protein QGG64_14245 [Candidatus Latescibacteria bacterium]|jgi:hypothetical protein|nr:hypothetical protein [Candidatus Latescibacterota bacterium]